MKMQELKLDELKKVEGGFELSAVSILAISLGIPFTIGVLDGFFNPNYSK